jgi:hypothetical protein
LVLDEVDRLLDVEGGSTSSNYGNSGPRIQRMDAVNVVLVASLSVGPDEYTHVSGPTGRAGKSGNVIYVISDADMQKVTV